MSLEYFVAESLETKIVAQFCLICFLDSDSLIQAWEIAQQSKKKVLNFILYTEYVLQAMQNGALQSPSVDLSI